MRWKQHKWKVILPVLIGAVLVFAYWYGGSGPGLQGWTVEQPSPSAAPTPSSSVSVSTPAAPAPSPTRPPSPPPSPPPPSPSLPPSPSPFPLPSPTPTPVPEEKPTPAEPQDAEISDAAHTCTLSISCTTILDNMDWLDPEKAELVPEDGWILEPTEVAFRDGESVFDVLQRTCRQNKIHMEFSDTPAYNSAYIEGIHNLYEFDCGEQSGWMYRVNGWFPNYGCSRYALQEGDIVEWVYTCDMGADVGSYNTAGG